MSDPKFNAFRAAVATGRLITRLSYVGTPATELDARIVSSAQELIFHLGITTLSVEDNSVAVARYVNTTK